MAHQLSMQTRQQSLVFFPYQDVSRRDLYDSFALAQQARNRFIGAALGTALGHACNAVAGLITGYFQRQDLRRKLMSMDARMLDDIGLTRGDIEDLVTGKIKNVPITPSVAKPEEIPAANPVMVEAVLRRAA